MSDKGPVPKAYWILSAILCLCTLAALWATAWKIRTNKVEARIGGRQAEPSDTDRPRKVVVPRGKTGRAGHFRLRYAAEGTLAVHDENARLLVTFPGLSEGERRAWQELQLRWLTADAKSALVEVEFRPGAPCRGFGDYAALRAGLRIELDDELSLSVERWDPEKPELFLISSRGSSGGLGQGGAVDFPPYRARLLDRVLVLDRH